MKPQIQFYILLIICPFFNTSLLAQKVTKNTDGDFITFTSPYYAIAFTKKMPMLAYFNIESGGRSRRLLDKNLLRPGFGGSLVLEGNSSLETKCESTITDNKINYAEVDFNGKSVKLDISAIDVRNFEFSISSNKKIEDEFFRISTAPDISPVTVWAEHSSLASSKQYDTEKSFFHPGIIKTSYRLPAIFHFPDYGLVKVEADNNNVYLQEHIIPDYSNSGLSLGPFNRGGHTNRLAYHKGRIVLSFWTENPVEKVKLHFSVMDENYPHIAGCDFSANKFDGLKRCWQNSFPVNPSQQCMGDNILLNGIGHLSMGFKADMMVFTPELPSKVSMINALKKALDSTFTTRVQANGRIKDYGWESTEVSLISLYDYMLITNDWNFIRNHLSQIKKVTQSVLNTDTDGDGIFESPFSGNKFEDKRSSWNWWDDFAFGYKDAYVNLKAHRALTGMQEIYTKLDLKKEATSIRKQLEKFRAAFHKTFFNPKTGVYGGWISKDGKMHDYMFTFINGMAINQGLVPPGLAKSIMQKLLIQLEKEGYDFVYGVPGPAMEVARADRQGWEEMAQWGRYENGGLCGHTAYYFIQALYNVGMKEKADEILFKMLATFENLPTHSGLFPGYLQSVDWRTKGGAPTGYNYLADNYYFLLAVVTGYYGIEFPKLKIIE